MRFRGASFPNVAANVAEGMALVTSKGTRLTAVEASRFFNDGSLDCLEKREWSWP